MVLLHDKISYLYSYEKLSAKEIAVRLKCAPSTVDYWLNKLKVKKRSISEASYLKHNPNGDPFSLRHLSKPKDYFIFGLGLGLYWGEGTKSNISSIRLGNTDPDLIQHFILFLKKIYNIDQRKLKFGLQIFSNMDSGKALKFWMSKLQVPKGSFQKVVVTPKRGVGTYTRKIEHGVLTVYFNNKKLRDILCGEIEKMRQV